MTHHGRRERLRGILRRTPTLIVIGLMIVYATFFSAYTVTRHRAFLTLGFDLGNIDQVLWSTTQGRILRYTNWPGGTFRFGNHFEPILLPLALAYFIHSGPETLLVLQTIIVAAGAWPIYRTTGRKLRSDWMGALFALVYLLFPGLEAANRFDFHAVTLAATFLAWAFWSVERQRYGDFVVWGVLAASCKEDMPLLVAMMGLWVALRGRRWLGGLTFGVGVAWAGLALLFIIPSFNTLDVSPQLWRYSHLGSGPREMVVNLVTQPSLYVATLTEPRKILYLIKLLFPTGYLALLAPHVLALAGPSFAVNLLSSMPHMIALETFHYAAPLVPFVTIAGAYGLEVAVRGFRRVLTHVDRRFLLAVLGCYVLVMALFYHRTTGHTPLAAGFEWPQIGQHERIGHDLIAEIPPDAAVSAQDQLNPHLTQRERIYVFPRLEDAEFALIDVTAHPYIDPVETFHAQAHRLLGAPDWGVVRAIDGYILFRRGAGADQLPPAFYTPFEAPAGSDSVTTQAGFWHGPQLADVDWWVEPRGTLNVETVWLRPEEPMEAAEIVIQLVESPAGWQPGAEQELILSRWYPLQMWPPDRPVRDVAELALTHPPQGLWIALACRSTEGQQLQATVTGAPEWQVDATGTVLLVPLSLGDG
jgi:uncharacterized membrane protein